jgi:nicotinate-nucleotide adenylyltransferase
MREMKIGVFGGTFNPVHFGHLRVAEEVREQLGFEKILFIPSSNPPLKSASLAPGRDRYEMTRLAVAGNPFFEISDIECRRPGKSYTVETVAALMKQYPDTDLSLIVGIDSFLDIPAWYQPQRLMELAGFVVISRPGFLFSSLSALVTAERGVLSELDAHQREFATTAMKNGREVFLMNVTPFHVSATSVRTRVQCGRSVKYLLPDAVESYIISHHLYREGSDPFRKQG